MSTTDPPTTTPSKPNSPTSAVEVETFESTEIDPQVAAAKALLKKKPTPITTGGLDSDDTSPESPAPPAAEIEPAAADWAAVVAPARAASFSNSSSSSSGAAEVFVTEPLAASTVASGEEVKDAQEDFSASNDCQEPPGADSVAARKFST